MTRCHMLTPEAEHPKLVLRILEDTAETEYEDEDWASLSKFEHPVA